MKEIQNKSDKESQVRRVNLEERSISEKAALKSFKDQIKLKIKRLRAWS